LSKKIFSSGFKKYLVLGSFLALFVTLLAACGNENSPTTTNIATTTTANQVATTNATTTIPSATTAPVVITSLAGTPSTTVAAPGSNSTPTATPDAKGGLTMKEAFALVDQQVKNWQADAVYVSIFTNAEKQLGLESDGRTTEWFFQAVSVKGGRRTTWLVAYAEGKFTATKSGDEELTEDKIKFQAEQALPPIATLIDSNELMAVAKQNGGDKSERPVGFRLAKSAKEGSALSFDLVFEQAGKSTLIRIDALTGKVLDNARG
jgi:hypothetical protein